MCLSIAIERPDDVLATGEHAGHQWVVTNNGRGCRCGYVRVPKDHPWHGKEWDELREVRVHGGISFAEKDVACGKGDDGYWIGFDATHGGDEPDPTLPGADRGKYDGAFGGPSLPFLEFMLELSDDMCSQPRDVPPGVRTQEYMEAVPA